MGMTRTTQGIERTNEASSTGRIGQVDGCLLRHRMLPIRLPKVDILPVALPWRLRLGVALLRELVRASGGLCGGLPAKLSLNRVVVGDVVI